MKSLINNGLHFILFFLAFICLMSLQGSVWMQLFTQAPNPSLWITLIVFTCFYRNLFEFILSVYVISFIAAPFTSIPLGLFILCNSSLAFALLLIRSRFIIQRPIYLAFVTFFMTLIFPIIHFCASQLIELNPIHQFEYLNWFISGMITFLLSISLYHFYIWFDQVMSKKWPREVGV